MADISSLEAWIRRFEVSRLGKSALNDLGKHFPPDKESQQTPLFHPLRDAVLISCYGAAMFDRNRDPITEQHNDPSQKERRANAKAQKELSSQRTAITTLQNFAREHQRAARLIFSQIYMDLIPKKIRITDGEKRNMADLLNCILETITSRLVRPIPFEATWPPTNRFDYGCLHYATPLDRGNNKNGPKVETMLLFDLVQTFRLRSKGICVRQTGQTMPKNGTPHISLATAFVNATFKDKPSMKAARASSRLKAHLRTNPGLGYYPWPALRNSPNR